MPSIFKRLPSTQPQRATPAIFSDQALNVLGPNVCKALAEKQMETKRKGAKEIEELIRFYQEKELSVAREQTTSMLNILLAEFLESQNRDIQIGGLIGVLGAARGLQENLKYYLGQIMVPVLKKFSETQETTLRYYAAECIYNLCILAPAGVKCLLDELLGLVFALWKDGDARLARPASITDTLVRDLTAKYATQQQVLSLLSQVTAEAGAKSSSAPTYLIPWLDLLTEKAIDIPEEVPVSDVLTAIVEIAAFQLSDEDLDRLESLIERLVVFMKQQPDSKSLEALKVLDKRSPDIIQECSGSSLSILTSFASAICGVGASRRRFQVPTNVKLDLDEETREFIAKMAPALLPLVLSLLSRPGLNSEFLKMLSARIQEAVSRSPTRNFLVASLSKVLTILLASGRQQNNFSMIESVLQWLIFLSSSSPRLELPAECISLISSLISSDRSNIRQMAVNCVVELVQDDSSLQHILNGTVHCLGEVECESQAVASFGIIQELLSKHEADAINRSLTLMPRTTPEEIFQYIVTCYHCAYALYSSNLYLTLSDTSGWSHTQGTALSMRILGGKDFKFVLDPKVPGDFIISQIEVMVLLAGMPNCWMARLSPELYSMARLMLPITSQAYSEVSRYPPSASAEVEVRESSWSLPFTASSFSLWNDKYAPRLRRVLIPLIRRAMAQWAPENESFAKKEASSRAAVHETPGQTVHVGSSSRYTSALPQHMRNTDKHWQESHEEQVICQETPTRLDNALGSAAPFLPPSPTQAMEDAEAREEVKEEKRPSEAPSMETAVVDLSINDTPNQSTILSDISTEPNSPTASRAFQSYYGKTAKGRAH